MPICHKRNASWKRAELDSFFKAGWAVLEARPAAALSRVLAGTLSWHGLHWMHAGKYCSWKMLAWEGIFFLGEMFSFWKHQNITELSYFDFSFSVPFSRQL